MTQHQKVGSIITGTHKTSYVAYDNAYRVLITKSQIHKHKKSLENEYQKRELEYRHFVEALTPIVGLSSDEPIATFELDPQEGIMNLCLNDDIKILSCNLKNGSISVEYSTFGYFSQRFISAEEAVTWLDNLLTTITKELASQALKADSIKMKNLVALNLQQKKMKLAGSFKDWIPYVYAGLQLNKLYQILSLKNNPDYATTGKIAISVETAKTLSSIHNSFAEQLFEPISN